MKEQFPLDFTLTLACNNNCVFCPRKELLPIVIEPERAPAAIRKAGGCSNAVLTGGEPTTLPDLAGIAGACKAAGAQKITLTTNGRTISVPAYLDKLVSSGINYYTISLYSHLPEVHDRLTRVKGSCAQTWKGLSNAMRLKRAGKIEVGVNTVLCAENIRTADKTLRMMKLLGVDTVLLINPSGPAEKHIFSYSLVKPLLRKLKERPSAYPARVIFRGFPLCLFPEGVPAENQDIEGAGGVSGANLSRYSQNFRTQFTKPPALCRGCRSSSRCNGIYTPYLKKYSVKGLGK